MLNILLKFFTSGVLFKQENRWYSFGIILVLLFLLIASSFTSKGFSIDPETAIALAIAILALLFSIFLVIRNPTKLTNTGASIIFFAVSGLGIAKLTQIFFFTKTDAQEINIQLINSNVRMELERCDTGEGYWSTSPTLEKGKVNHCKFKIYNFSATKPAISAQLALFKKGDLILGTVKYRGEYSNTQYLSDPNDRIKFYKPSGSNTSLSNTWYIVITTNLKVPSRQSLVEAVLAADIKDDSGKTVLTEKIKYGIASPR